MTTPWEFYQSIALPAQLALIDAARRGVLVDTNRRDEYAWESRRKLTKLRGELEHILGNVWGPLGGFSAVSLPKAFRERLGIQTYHQGPSEEDSILLYRGNYPQHAQVLDQVLEYKNHQKLLSTYYETPLEPGGRFRTSYRVLTDTGRSSSAGNAFDRGGNIQNIPKHIRDCFIPDPGYVMWGADASQIEARITAWWFEDPGYVEDFLQGRDVHLEAARRLFRNPGIEQDDVIPGFETEGYTYRDVGKRFIHAANYMASWVTLHKTIMVQFPGFSFSATDAKKFIAIFRSYRSGVVRGWGDTATHLRSSRLIRTPFGRQRWFHDRYGEALIRRAVAYVPQSTAADHIARGYIQVTRRFRHLRKSHTLAPKTAFLLQVHDSVVGQCKEEEIPLVKEEVSQALTLPLPLEYQGTPLVVPCGFKVGNNWKEVS